MYVPKSGMINSLQMYISQYNIVFKSTPLDSKVHFLNFEFNARIIVLYILSIVQILDYSLP